MYTEYERRKHEAGALDFDDLISETVRLFRDHPEVLEHYQERFRYILVDEYQDTNRAQYELVNMLAAGTATSAWWATRIRACTRGAGRRSRTSWTSSATIPTPQCS